MALTWKDVTPAPKKKVSYGEALRMLEIGLEELKEKSLPREPYAAAKYLLLYLERELNKDRESNHLSPTCHRDYLNLVKAIQNVTVYL